MVDGVAIAVIIGSIMVRYSATLSQIYRETQVHHYASCRSVLSRRVGELCPWKVSDLSSQERPWAVGCGRWAVTHGVGMGPLKRDTPLTHPQTTPNLTQSIRRILITSTHSSLLNVATKHLHSKVNSLLLSTSLDYRRVEQRPFSVVP